MSGVYGGTSRYLRNAASTTQNLCTTFVDLERATDEEISNSFRKRLAKQAPSRPLVLVGNTFMSPFIKVRCYLAPVSFCIRSQSTSFGCPGAAETIAGKGSFDTAAAPGNTHQAPWAAWGM